MDKVQEKIPTFYMLIGIPNSGKSHYSEFLASNYNTEIYSTDAVREEFFNGIYNKEQNGKVFEITYKKVYRALSLGKM